MLEFSVVSLHAIKAVVFLAKRKDDQPVPSRLIAGATGLPELFLSKILGKLAKAGLMETWTGSSGGYRLARPAKEITLLRIVEALHGRIYLEDPFPLAGNADGTEEPMKAVFDAVADLVRREWQKIKVTDLMRK